ncbi:MAG: FHA domain-containing protein [Labilithrix sp.]|nr:FHA domain-containing protein [Labilithrix sp.]MCW5816815.1 FHA domain-containing protein [Labilithrix sp.]
MARLILATAEGQQAIELRPINSLGRHPNNSIQLLDKIVSKEHCILEQRDGGVVLRDLGSLNGTYVNGERVRGEMMLRHGDEIALGSTRARFDDGHGPPLDFNAPLPHGGMAQPHISPGAIQHHHPMPGSNPQMANQLGGMGGGPMSPQGPWSKGSVPPPTQQPSIPGQGMHPGHGPMGTMGMPSVPHPGSQQPRPPYPSSPYNQAVHPPHPGGAGQSGGYPPHGGAGRRPPSFGGTRVDVLDSARAIGTQINAQQKGFLPYDQLAHDPQQIRVDYERLRLTWELTRDIGLERDLDQLLHKILMSLFKFVNADRAVILLREGDGSLAPKAAHRRDGTDSPIQVSSTILNHVIQERAAVLTHDASMDFASSKGKSMILNRISSAIVVPLLHEKDVLGAIWLDSESLAQFQQKDLELLTAVANQAAMFIENNLLAKKIEQEIVNRERFSRLLSPNVAEQVLSGKLEVKKGGVHVPECTVFNSDIRGFTRMSEGATAGVINDLLNEYFEAMVETIFKYEGTLDKFMGDGIMAFWGAPVHRQDDAVRSVQCALDQMEVLGKFNRKRVESGHPPLAVGMGLHTGPLVAGYVGSSKAMSYTVIGDTANTSARLCGIALAGQVIVSEYTLARLGPRFEVEELPPAALKGKEKPLRIYNVKREKPSAVAKVG